jgi:hypothetical protein
MTKIINTVKERTPNGRFGASGAVARPKVCANLDVLRPSERQCKPLLRQAAGTLAASVEVAVHKAMFGLHLRQQKARPAKP